MWQRVAALRKVGFQNIGLGVVLREDGNLQLIYSDTDRHIIRRDTNSELLGIVKRLSLRGFT